MSNTYNQAPMLQKHQLITPQNNIFMPDNTTVLHNLPHNNESAYFTQQPLLQCQSINTDRIHQPQNSLNSHSIMTAIENAHQTIDPGHLSLYNSRIAGMYSNPTGASNLNCTTDILENNANGSRSSKTIFIDNYGSKIQTNQSVQSEYEKMFPSTMQLQHSSYSRQQQPTQQSHGIQRQNLVPSHAAATSTQTMQMQLASGQPIYLSTSALCRETNPKISAYLPFNMNNSCSSNQLNRQTVNINETFSHLPTTSNSVSTNSTSRPPVVLDRINICINNHYTDSSLASALDAGTEETPPLPSPIIPPIQHNAVIDPILLESLTNNSNLGTITNTAKTASSVIHEPDSTTASHTPPSTPENITVVSCLNSIQSPSTSSTAAETLSAKTPDANSIPFFKTNTDISPASIQLVSEVDEDQTEVYQSSPMAPSDISFNVGEDVFVRKEDDRLYLGTIIDSKYEKYRVRFDDSSEWWCSSKEMRKFGLTEDKSLTPRENSYDNDTVSFCVACKKHDHIEVEICERCGRGYHQKCTTETSPGSGEWICKRCSKSMKVDIVEYEFNEELNNCTALLRKQLPYDVQKLHWDNKHRVNEEQIYCYCGKSGQFDYSMLQCCKCLNWFHTQCVENFIGTILRGDGFFIFCCAICSLDGDEFLRRLQMNRVDFMHLVLYNLSAQRKHQHNKYHHLVKDIYPFVLSQRNSTAMPEEWTDLTDDELKDCILATLKKNADRFICGREIKRDHYIYGLRNNGPPSLPKINVQKDAVLNDEFICEVLKLNLSKRAKQNPTSLISSTILKDYNSIPSVLKPGDIDEKFTSDDDIPIKSILEKEMKCKTVTNEFKYLEKIPNKSIEGDDKFKNRMERKSHKRKAFTLSKPYKESVKRDCNASAISCESSSDENSSSSRSTSLDLIIPPPKDFLGLNNPFRTVTPKKCPDKKSILHTRNILGGPTIKNSIVNTSSALNFCTNLAALKNAGIFPNLTTTNLTKTAAGQPRMVRTIKRRLSAKDIMIGPNQEVRRRRTRRLSSNIEVISTTTINPISIPSNFFPSINTKELFTASSAKLIRKQSYSNMSINGQFISKSKVNEQFSTTINGAVHGRRLRLRKQKSIPATSRRSSLSSASTSSNSSSSTTTQLQTDQPTDTAMHNKLQQTVNEYFGIGDLILTGEQFSIHAKRELYNGQIQLLIEWGTDPETVAIADTTTVIEIEDKDNKIENS